MQALVINPIADPYILAALPSIWRSGMGTFNAASFFAGQYQVMITAMFGAFIASALVYFMARAGGGDDPAGYTALPVRQSML